MSDHPTNVLDALIVVHNNKGCSANTKVLEEKHMEGKKRITRVPLCHSRLPFIPSFHELLFVIPLCLPFLAFCTLFFQNFRACAATSINIELNQPKKNMKIADSHEIF